ncbi:hypothetical protein [Paenibacillus sp. FSL K6-2859]|uniref:hypothetical protein n=1 Tax=Paenibacillus sp. FSL K6-2859 TaxID=2921482 RepID=UPI0030F8335F
MGSYYTQKIQEAQNFGRSSEGVSGPKAPRSGLYAAPPFFLFSFFKNLGDEVAEWRFGAGETKWSPLSSDFYRQAV